MINFINLFLEDKIFSFFILAFLFLFLYVFTFIVQYVYLSCNLKGICRLVYGDERHYKIPLNPFDSYFIGLVPLVFFREVLNIKQGMSFKKLYNKDFFFIVRKNELVQLLNKFPFFFYIQYTLIFFGIFFLIFLTFACLLLSFS
nr:hypothetical protein F987_00861 [Acinetobacter gyllenbergii NIPH 230]